MQVVFPATGGRVEPHAEPPTTSTRTLAHDDTDARVGR